MTKRLILATVVSAALLAFSSAALAQSDNNAPRNVMTPPSQINNPIRVGNPMQSLQAAKDACSGKAQGDACTFVTAVGSTITGNCRSIGGAQQQMLCLPNFDGVLGGRVPSQGQPGTPPSANASGTADPACLKAAITKQSQTVLGALDAFYAASKNSFTARTTALLAALDLTGTDRQTAVQAATKDFQDSQKAAQDAWQKARLDSATQFRTDQQACGGGQELNLQDGQPVGQPPRMEPQGNQNPQAGTNTQAGRPPQQRQPTQPKQPVGFGGQIVNFFKGLFGKKGGN